MLSWMFSKNKTDKSNIASKSLPKVSYANIKLPTNKPLYDKNNTPLSWTESKVLRGSPTYGGNYKSIRKEYDISGAGYSPREIAHILGVYNSKGTKPHNAIICNVIQRINLMSSGTIKISNSHYNNGGSALHRYNINKYDDEAIRKVRKYIESHSIELTDEEKRRHKIHNDKNVYRIMAWNFSIKEVVEEER